jgi:ribosomal protein S6 kinase alpha-1/2/3/6
MSFLFLNQPSIRFLLEVDSENAISGSGTTGVEELKAHQFFATINWEKLLKRQVVPPFKPVASRVDDAFYFDTQFTSKTPRGTNIVFTLLKLDAAEIVSELPGTL